ncbi:MAG: metallophosphoesterase [Pedosphaera sp.]|nr:metallophosphoesterase [Pedosphaera sp.]
MLKASFSVLSVRNLVSGLCLLIFWANPVPAQTNETNSADYSFMVAGDMRGFLTSDKPGKRYFDGACEAMKRVGPGAFLLSPGDCDAAAATRAVMDQFLGSNYLWYPLVGNHDAEKPANLAWFHQWAKAGIPHLVRSGPAGSEETTFSFDYGNSHFILLDEYFDGHVTSAANSADIGGTTLAWLEQDLAATRQPVIWVSGHKPIESLPDMDTGYVRHAGESITANAVRREQFLELLRKYHVRGYICGHTHNSSIAKVKGVWQLDSGHSRGGHINPKTESPSTFLKVHVTGARVAVDVYRADNDGLEYKLTRTVVVE